MVSLGKIGELETRVEWKIPDFDSLSRDVGKYYESEFFHFGGTRWQMRIYPSGLNYFHGRIFVHLVKEPSSARSVVQWKLGLKKPDGTIEITREWSHTFGEDVCSSNFCLVEDRTWRSDLQRYVSKFSQCDALTIVSYLKIAGPESMTTPDPMLDGLGALSRDLHDLLYHKKACDTTLVVEGVTFEAHKIVLVARSPVFAAMFENDMSEKKTGSVIIPDCDKESFCLFLAYLYTGKVQNVSFHTAVPLYRIAHKYDVRELVSICVSRMKSNMEVEGFFDAVTLADQYGEDDLLSALRKFFKRHFSQFKSTEEWESFKKDNCELASKFYSPKRFKNSN